ncbi:MAG: ROK family protein [Chlamydiota bacterium]
MLLLGVDIGGTKITVCLGDRLGKVLTSQRFPTKPSLGYRYALERVKQTAAELCLEQGLSLRQIKAVGISCPGPLDITKGKLLSPPNLKQWKNLAITANMQTAFRKPVFLNNDGNAAALAVYYFGNHGKKNLIYLTASTGMGGGLIIDGRLVQGLSDTAGEVGHFVIVPGGRRCPCGQRGCFEAYCGGKMFARYVATQLKKSRRQSKILTLSGGKWSKIDMEAILKAVIAKDRFALSVWREFIDKLAQGIGTLLMVVNPELVVLGTLAIHAGPVLLNPLRKKLEAYCWSEPRRAKIIASKLQTQISEKSALAVAIYGMKIGGH